MNTIVAIGGLSNYNCYLNVPYEQAVKRYLTKMNTDPYNEEDYVPLTYSDIKDSIKVINFEDEFSAYDIEI